MKQARAVELIKVVASVGLWKQRAISRDETLYYSAKFVVQVAQNLFLATLFVIAGTGSNAAIGLSSLFVAMLIPSVAFGFFGGAIADRIGPSHGFLVGSLLRLAVAVAAVLVGHGAVAAWIIAFVYFSLVQVSHPAELALVRNLRGDAPGRAHSLIVALQYVGQGIGMLALAPALYFVGGPTVMFLGAVVCFAVLALLTLSLAFRLRGTAAARKQPARDAFSLRATLRVFRQQSLAREAVAVLALKSVIAQGIVIALPLYLKHDPLIGRWSLASLLIPGALGTVAGLLWATGSSSRIRAHTIMRLSLIGMVFSVWAYAALDFGLMRVPPLEDMGPRADTTLVLALAVAFLLGVALAAAIVSGRTAITHSAPLGTQSRTFAVQSALSDGIVAIPLLLLGFGGQLAGSAPIFTALGVMGLLTLLAVVWPVGPFRLRTAEPAFPDP